MFKIKENVNLKELENFGYNHWQIGFNGNYYKNIKKGSYQQVIIYNQVHDWELLRLGIREKYIYLLKDNIWLKASNFWNKKYIKDLINAGLVEKVKVQDEDRN